MSNWKPSEREVLIRDGRRWADLGPEERRVVWSDRAYEILPGACDDLVSKTNLTVRRAMELLKMTRFDLADEVGRSLGSDDPYGANKKFENRDISSTDPDDSAQWPSWKSYLLKRATQIVLPRLLQDRGREVNAVKDELTALSDDHGRHGRGARATMSDDIRDIEAEEVRASAETADRGHLHDVEEMTLDDLPLDDEEGGLDYWGSDGDNPADEDDLLGPLPDMAPALEAAFPGLIEKTTELQGAAEAALSEMGTSRKVPAEGGGAWAFDEETGDFRYFTGRHAFEALIKNHLAGYDERLEVTIPDAWVAEEKALGRSLTTDERAAVAYEVRQTKTATDDLMEKIVGVRPSHPDFSNRLVCHPGFQGTDSGKDRHRDAVAEHASPLSFERKKARTKLRRALKDGGEKHKVDAAQAEALEATEAFIESLEANFAHRVPRPGIGKKAAAEAHGACDVCQPPKTCSKCGEVFRPTDARQTKCETHRRKKEPPNLVPEVIAHWVAPESEPQLDAADG